jgi:hypothetical protein
MARVFSWIARIRILLTVALRVCRRLIAPDLPFMPARRHESAVRVLHPFQWLWEPLESDPSFLLRSMFGAKAAYLDGKLMLCFCAGDEPWHGVLVCTDRAHHDSLRLELPSLTPHPILPKWLYLRAVADDFESVGARLVALARRRDERMGVAPKPRKSKRRKGGRPR